MRLFFRANVIFFQVLLSAAALISLALGLFQDFGTERETYSCGPGRICTEPPVEWIEGELISPFIPRLC